MAVSTRHPHPGRRVRSALAGFVIALAVGVGAAPAEARSFKGPDSVADLAEALQGAVVNISTSQNVTADRSIPMPRLPEGSPFKDLFEEFMNRQGRGGPQGQQQPPRRSQSLGSGFVVDFKDGTGIIVTNNHVIDGADEITANFNDGAKLKAELIGTDKKTDIAVLRVKSDKPLKTVPFGDSDKARVGDWVMAIGNPFGLGGTVTVGIVSARNRDINSGPYDNFIQTDAAINRGNSGGPLFNMAGEVVGINTAIISPSGGSIGLGFAIPSNLAVNVVGQIREFGETRRGWLGVSIQGVADDMAESLGLREPKGALVSSVTKGSPAETGGILTGDVIVRFDGRDIPNARDLSRIVADTPVGKAVDVTVMRKAKEETVKVTLGRLEETDKAQGPQSGRGSAPQVQPVVTKSLGLSLATLDAENRTKFKLGEKVTEGVVVTEVESGSAAAEKRVVAGDVILQVNQEKVKAPADITKIVDTLKKDGRRTALLLVSNAEGDVRFVAVRIE